MLRITLMLAVLLRYFPEVINLGWERWDRLVDASVQPVLRYLDRYYRVGRHRVLVNVEPVYRPVLARAAGPVPRALAWATK